MSVVSTDRRFEQVLSGAALVLLLLGCFFVLRPFLSALLWAIVLWLTTAPIHQRVLAWVDGRHTLAALIMTLGIAAVLLAPFVIVGLSVADSAAQFTNAAREWLAAPQPPSWLGSIPLIGRYAVEQWTVLAGDSEQLLQRARQLFEPVTAGVVSGGLAIGRGMIELTMSIFIAFFLFRDRVAFGDRFRAGATRIAGPSGELLTDLAVGTLHSVVYGILGTALAQGVLAGIGFLIAGVPGAVLLGLLTFFMSIVPMGPPLIWIPAAIWVYQHFGAGWAVFMVIWGLGVSSVDNFLKPWLISQGSTLPFILIFFGVIGGALAFGFIGVFLGPTLLAVGHRLVLDWAVVVRRKAAPESAPASVPAA